jgi:hypothetical protein
MQLNSLLNEFPQNHDSEIVRRAYQRAVECMKLSGEAEDDPDLYETMAKNVLMATRNQRELNFIRLTNRALELYRAQRAKSSGARPDSVEPPSLARDGIIAIDP